VAQGSGTEETGSEDSGEEGEDGSDVGEDLGPFVACGGDAEEYDVAGHGVGEDVSVVEIDDCVEESAGSGEEGRGGEGGGDGG